MTYAPPRPTTCLVALTLLFSLVGAACAWQSGEVGVGPDGSRAPLSPRRATIVAEACVLGPTQLEALTQASGIIRQVVLVCAQATDEGSLRFYGNATPQAIAEQIAQLRSIGLQPRIGLTYGAGPGMQGDPTAASARLADSAWRSAVVQQLADLDCDGFEVALPEIRDGSREDLTAFVAELSSAAPLQRAVGVFAPPSMAEPSDLPGGDAYDLAALRPHVDRIRLMTLDYSCCGAPPGPTLEPGWAAAVARLAGSKIPETMLDVTIPLYGVHFSAAGLQYLSYPEALGLSAMHQAQIWRNDSQAPYFRFNDASGAHEVWFDDRVSILSYLRSWNPPEIAEGIGIVFYGIGAEDSGLWPSLQEGLP